MQKRVGEAAGQSDCSRSRHGSVWPEGQCSSPDLTKVSRKDTEAAAFLLAACDKRQEKTGELKSKLLKF